MLKCTLFTILSVKTLCIKKSNTSHISIFKTDNKNEMCGCNQKNIDKTNRCSKQTNTSTTIIKIHDKCVWSRSSARMNTVPPRVSHYRISNSLKRSIWDP